MHQIKISYRIFDSIYISMIGSTIKANKTSGDSPSTGGILRRSERQFVSNFLL